MMDFSTDKRFSLKLDAEDKLSLYKSRFYIPDPNLIYLDGNSLGRLTLNALDDIENTLKVEWGRDLISSWNKSWINLPSEIGDKIASITGADQGEIIVADSTSVNLFKLAVAALKYQSGKKNIISDTLNFPSDLYVLQGAVDFLDSGHNIRLATSEDGISIDYNELESLIDKDTALICLSHVAFKTSFMYDMCRITKLAHDYGALVLWDLSHAVGAVPVKLKASGADLAVGCTYKYLNGGPGSPAFIYVNKKLQSKIQQSIWGWLGTKDPFSFNLDYIPANSIDRFVSGSPPIVSLKAINCGVDLLLEAGMENIRYKSIKQTEYLIYLAEQKLYNLGFALGSPKESNNRGSHVSLCHPESFRICKAMIDSGIIPDFRAPDSIRFGITPLYISYIDIYNAIEKLYSIVKNRLYEKYSFERGKVT